MKEGGKSQASGYGERRRKKIWNKIRSRRRRLRGSEEEREKSERDVPLKGF